MASGALDAAGGWLAGPQSDRALAEMQRLGSLRSLG
jgi:hypothetical protein